MSIDLQDLKRRARGSESVGVSNAMLLELIARAESAEFKVAALNEWTARIARMQSDVARRIGELRADDVGAIDDDPEDAVPCVGCGRVACSCERSAEGADEEACA